MRADRAERAPDVEAHQRALAACRRRTRPPGPCRAPGSARARPRCAACARRASERRGRVATASLSAATRITPAHAVGIQSARDGQRALLLEARVQRVLGRLQAAGGVPGEARAPGSRAACPMRSREPVAEAVLHVGLARGPFRVGVGAAAAAPRSRGRRARSDPWLSFQAERARAAGPRRASSPSTLPRLSGVSAGAVVELLEPELDLARAAPGPDAASARPASSAHAALLTRPSPARWGEQPVVQARRRPRWPGSLQQRCARPVSSALSIVSSVGPRARRRASPPRPALSHFSRRPESV